MTTQLPFDGGDLLQAVVNAAFSPRTEYSHVGYDTNNQPTVQYHTTPALIEPMIRLVQKFMDEDEDFRAALKAAVLARIDDMADDIVTKVAATNSAFGVAKVQQGYSSSTVTYKIADWLQGPLGEAMATALTPALREHFNGEDGKPNFSHASIEVSVTVKP